MMYCENCNVDLFGGSLCHHCGGYLIPKVVDKGQKVAHITSDALMGAKSRLTVDSAQSLAGRMFRVVIEVVLFCAIFWGLSYIIVGGINWLSREMSMNPDTAPAAIEIAGDPFKYFRYFGMLVVAILTIRFRFQPGK